MKRILSYIDYFTGCANAISKGLKTVVDSWPIDNPFSNKPITDEFKE